MHCAVHGDAQPCHLILQFSDLLRHLNLWKNVMQCVQCNPVQGSALHCAWWCLTPTSHSAMFPHPPHSESTKNAMHCSQCNVVQCSALHCPWWCITMPSHPQCFDLPHLNEQKTQCSAVSTM